MSQPSYQQAVEITQTQIAKFVSELADVLEGVENKNKN